MSPSCLDAGRLARYVTRELDAAGMLQAARHVAECSACAERARLLRRVEAAGVAGIADVLDRVASLVEELEKEPHHRWPLLVREPRFRDPHLAPPAEQFITKLVRHVKTFFGIHATGDQLTPPLPAPCDPAQGTCP